MEWEFNLPVKLIFGSGKRKDIKNILRKSMAKKVLWYVQKALLKMALLTNL